MRADVLIVGQGLAGTLLGWEMERRGLRFAVADCGHEAAATIAAAGIINPVTGRRLVKSWRVDALLPLARTAYGEIATAVGVPLWHAMRVRRFFADERERAAFRAKGEAGELAPFASAASADGEDAFWIEGAARVDLRALLASLRERWMKHGRMRVGRVDPIAEMRNYALVIDCRGVETARTEAFSFVPWEFSKGEVLEIAVEGLAPDVVLNRRHWVVPVREGTAWVGATHEPGVIDLATTAAGRAALEASGRELLRGEFVATGQRAGVRVNLPDKLPASGRHPEMPGLGVINGLGAKGALFAPMLAREWVEHFESGARFTPEIDVRRFAT